MKKTEASEQQAVIEWRDWVGIRDKRVSTLYHIPNGELRNKPVAAKLKKMGVRGGIPDLHLPVARFGLLRPYELLAHSLYIELKVKGGRLSPEQKAVQAELRELGHQVEVCFGATSAIWTIGDYLNLDPRLILGWERRNEWKLY